MSQDLNTNECMGPLALSVLTPWSPVAQVMLLLEMRPVNIQPFPAERRNGSREANHNAQTDDD